MTAPSILATIRTVNDGAESYRICMAYKDPRDRHDMLCGLAFEAAKRGTGHRTARKVFDVAINPAQTRGSVVLAVDGLYVWCTVNLVTDSLISADTRTMNETRGAA